MQLLSLLLFDVVLTASLRGGQDSFETCMHPGPPGFWGPFPFECPNKKGLKVPFCGGMGRTPQWFHEFLEETSLGLGMERREGGYSPCSATLLAGWPPASGRCLTLTCKRTVPPVPVSCQPLSSS